MIGVVLRQSRVIKMATAKPKLTKLGLIKTFFAVYWASVAVFGFFALIGVGSQFDGSNASPPPTGSSTTLSDTSGGQGFDVYVCNVLLPDAGYLVGALTMLMLVLAGVVYATSQGASSGDLSIGESKKMIVAALTGALLYVMGYKLLGSCGIGTAGNSSTGGGARGIIECAINGNCQ